MISNNFYNGEVIVSYDSNKIWEEMIENDISVCKKTTLNEVKNIKKMAKLLENKTIDINNHKYKLKVPNIYNWNESKKIISMEFCKGKNLEFYLRNEDTYNEGSLILNEILNMLIQNKIYWLDFAPRNIIVGDNKIYFVDYEKGFAEKDITIKEYFRNHVYEEYCIFLFLKDRKYSMDEIVNLNNEENEIININSITCSRIRKIAELQGYGQLITKKEYLQILEMLIVVQEPKIIKNNFYFPCVELDKIFINETCGVALEKYCKKIINLYEEIKNVYENK